MLGGEGFEAEIETTYLDIPSLHTFNNDGCRFFDILADSSCDLDIFQRKSIKILVNHKWAQVRDLIVKIQFMPLVILIITLILWNSFVRPYRYNWPTWNIFFCMVLLMEVLYTALIEAFQFYSDTQGYIDHWSKNLFEIIPICGVFSSCVYSMYFNKEEDIQLS